MKSVSAYRGAAAAALPGLWLLGLSMHAHATLIDVTIDAGVRTSNTESQCLFPTPGFTGHDCSYNATDPSGISTTKWVGPVYTGGFFPSGGAPQSTEDDFKNPTLPGDGRIGAPLSGTITINDQDNPAACSTHSIGGVIQMGPFSRNYGTQPSIRFIDDFPNGITQTIAAQVVNGGTANVAGGCDYVIGSVGVPNVLLTTAGVPVPNDPFPGQVSHNITPSAPRGSGSTEWIQPPAGTPGIARFEGRAGAPPNLGLVAVATLGAGYNCLRLNTDPLATPFPPVACASFSGTSWNNADQASWDNIVGRISTDSSGNITSSLLFFVQEVPVASGASWMAYTAAITGTAPGAPAAAVDDSASTLPNVATSINILANDTNFADPVTVSISVLSANGGLAVVVGSPGNAAGISVTYTPPSGFSGTDTFQYTATDGSGGNDTAIVTVTVANSLPVAGPGAINSISTAGFDPATRSGTINVANNPVGNSLGNVPAVVTATGATNGTVSVNGSTVTYTPLASFFQGTGSFSYTITDADSETATNTVTVTIPDVTPTVAGGNATGDRNTTLNTTGAFTPGNGSPTQHAVSVPAQGTNGDCVATLTANTVAVAYTPDAGYSGPDTCSVRVTDGDGDSAAADATFNFTVEGGLELPGGPGSLDLWSLTLLGALPLLRRRRRV